MNTNDDMAVAAQKAARTFNNLVQGDIITKSGDSKTKLLVLSTRPDGWKQLGEICPEHGDHVKGYPLLFKWSTELSVPVNCDNKPYQWWTPLSISVLKEEACALAREFSILPVEDDFMSALEALSEGNPKLKLVAKLMQGANTDDSITAVAALRAIGATISDEQAAMFILVKTLYDKQYMESRRDQLVSALLGERTEPTEKKK